MSYTLYKDNKTVVKVETSGEVKLFIPNKILETDNAKYMVTRS